MLVLDVRWLALRFNVDVLGLRDALQFGCRAGIFITCLFKFRITRLALKPSQHLRHSLAVGGVEAEEAF